MVDHVVLRDKAKSYAKSLGVFSSVIACHPASAPTSSGMTFAFWFGPIFPAPRESGLSATSVVQTMFGRLFAPVSV